MGQGRGARGEPAVEDIHPLPPLSDGVHPSARECPAAAGGGVTRPGCPDIEAEDPHGCHGLPY